MMETRRIFTRLFLSHSVIGLFAVILLSILFYVLIRNALIERTNDQLAAVNALKEQEIDNYFNQHQKDLKFLFTHDFFLEHFGPTVKLPLSKSSFPKEVGTEINSVLAIYDFTEIIVLNPSLHTVYSTSEKDFEYTEILTDVTTSSDSFFWIDASTTVKSGRTVLLYVVPFVKNGVSLGYIVVRENFMKVERLLLQNEGMGKTGECYLVGPDNTLRSVSRFFPLVDPLTITIREEDTDLDHVRIDYRGEQVISLSRPLTNPALKWKMVTEIDFSEAMEPVVKFRNYLLIATLAVALLIVAVSIVSSNAISKPVRYLQSIIMQLAKGVLPGSAVHVKNKDEIGEIANAVNQLVSALAHTTEFANEIGRGNFQTQYTLLSGKDTLGQALVNMRDQLRQFNEREIRLVREKTAAVLEGQENERKRITRELHDGVGQLLTAIRLKTDIVPMDDANRKELVALLNDTINEVKRISYNVMPAALVDFGLEAALKGLCDNTSRYSKLRFDFRFIRESSHELSFDITVAVFRIVQEGINNILKHANATNVELHVIDNVDELYILLKDDGTGFTEDQITPGLGLRSMRERAQLLQGVVDIHSGTGEGTVIEVRIPLPD